MDGLNIVAGESRNGTITLTAKLDGGSLTDRISIARLRDRQRFAEEVVKQWPAVQRQDVSQELERLAAEHTERADRQPAAGAPELDLSRILRPERFVTSHVSALAVPLLAEIGGRPVGRWTLMLQWADGKREQVDLPGKLALPDGGCLWVAPTPAEPNASTARALSGWSAAGRRAWLDGADAPDAADLFRRLCERFAWFIDLPADTAAGTTASLALWTMLSYGYAAFDAVPYLHLAGPLASGKSRTFDVLTRLVFRPLSSSSLTGPALFRTLHDRGGVLLLDEAERLRQPGPETAELLSMLLAGYRRGGVATRLESVGDTFRTVSFDVFALKALACIAGLPPALASRCVTVRMFRAGPDSPKPRRRIDADPAGWQELRDDLHALALSAGPAWLDLAKRTDVVPAMSGRAFELWQPLLALASWVDQAGADGLLDLMQKYALGTIDASRDDATPACDETLLRLLADELRAGLTAEPGGILAKARAADEQGFSRWSARGVSEHLRRYGLATYRSQSRRVYGRDCLDVLRRVQAVYGVELGFDGETIRADRRLPSPTVADRPAGGETGEKPLLGPETQVSE